MDKKRGLFMVIVVIFGSIIIYNAIMILNFIYRNNRRCTFNENNSGVIFTYLCSWTVNRDKRMPIIYIHSPKNIFISDSIDIMILTYTWDPKYNFREEEFLLEYYINQDIERINELLIIKDTYRIISPFTIMEIRGTKIGNTNIEVPTNYIPDEVDWNKIGAIGENVFQEIDIYSIINDRNTPYIINLYKGKDEKLNELAIELIYSIELIN